MKTALILFAHGARDPRWAEPFQRLQAKLANQLSQQQVALAFLELMTPSLPDVVTSYVHQGVKEITVIPVFFGQGGHIRKDLPLLIESIQATHPQLSIRCAPAVGEDEAVLSAIAAYCFMQFNPTENAP